MSQLIVRKLDDRLVRELKVRAGRHGRSVEGEHREILRQALRPRPPVKDIKRMLLEMPPAGRDSDFARARDTGRDPEL